jgi:release factor glutamine methyltransferase
MCEEISYDRLLQEGTASLAKNGILDAGLDSWLLLEYVTGMSRSQYFLKKDDHAAQGERETYRKLVAQRASHIPLQHLTGEQEFMGLPFWVNRHVLVPRQDTECLVETAMEYVKGKRILDMCTGSGCIAVSLAVLGKPEVCCAVDLSQKALETAQKNAVRNGAAVTFLESNLFEKVEGRYDVIVSNPPYIPPKVIEGLSAEVREHEPRMALDGGADGLAFYRRITRDSKEHLTDGGWLFYEIGCEQAEDVMGILRAEGFYKIALRQDYTGKDRVVCASFRLAE